MIPVVIWGAGGRMGRRVLRIVLESGEYHLRGAVENCSHPGITRDAGEYHGMKSTGVYIVPLPDDQPGPGVVLDFSLAGGPAMAADWAGRNGWALVSGTTALSPRDQEALREASMKVPVLLAPNFSIGIQLLMKCVQLAAAALPPEFDCSILDTHHTAKKDRPSGTARVFEQIVTGDGRSTETASFRSSDVVGEHCIRFRSPVEDIRFQHAALNRDVFARGALHVARWIHGKPAGWYTMEDVIQL